MSPLDLVNLTRLMNLTSGKSEIAIGLIDGPVASEHSAFTGKAIREVSNRASGKCTQADSVACAHGTFVAGILCANRASAALAICPDCSLLVHSIFAETTAGHERFPSAAPEELATAIVTTINAGARILNLSVALVNPTSQGQRELEEALDYALQQGVIVVAAAGNQGALGSSALTRHPWVIPVIACDLQGRPIHQSNLGSSIGRHGLSAPGDSITSLSPTGKPYLSGGTSVATPFVTGAISLLWSEFPTAKAAQIKFAMTHASSLKRTTVIPPLLNAWAAYQAMATVLI